MDKLTEDPEKCAIGLVQIEAGKKDYEMEDEERKMVALSWLPLEAPKIAIMKTKLLFYTLRNYLNGNLHASFIVSIIFISFISRYIERNL